MNKEINNLYNSYFNNYSNEKINGCNYNVLPSLDNIPKIQKYGYDENKDIFEILFEYNIKKTVVRKTEYICFIESTNGILVAIQILDFKRHNIKSIKMKVTTNINNIITRVSLDINKGLDIPKSIVEKRKLNFIKDTINNINNHNNTF